MIKFEDIEILVTQPFENQPVGFDAFGEHTPATEATQKSFANDGEIADVLQKTSREAIERD